MQTASILVYIYAMLVMLGGTFGFIKARSLPSLIAGEVSGLLLIAAGYGLGSRASWGLPLALALIALLWVFFSVRYYRTRVFMPGGLMSILSILALIGVYFAARG